MEGESTFKINSTNIKFSRISASIQNYSILFYPETVLAFRLEMQSLFGKDLPVQVLLPVGGNRSLRGYPQDRFLGKTSALFNTEIRFPIFRKIGGIFGFDAGTVSNSLKEIDISHWAINPVIGLRYYMKNFIIRLDVGFGKDSTGFYFNFGHIF